MSDDAKVIIDDREVQNFFKDLDYKNLKKTYKQALRKSANLIAKEAKSNFKRRMRQLKKSNGRKVKLSYYSSMAKGIKVKVDKNGKDAKVHVMGDWRLRFFEKGTVVRVTKGNNNRGKISALYFFRDAVESKKGLAEDLMITHLKEAIIKIYNKK